MKTIRICLFVILFSCLVGCKQLNVDRSLNSDRINSSGISVPSNLTEVPSPKIIKTLNKDLTHYVPQIKIVTPKAQQTFDRTEVMVTLEAQNLPIFENSKSQVGNHLNLIVDNEPFQPIYDLDQPIIIKDLTPGTHTIRVFAVRPWGESYKNEGAYAQTTFNVLTETNNNLIDPSQPLLTYNSPTGTYGAQPVLLDFYLTNAPLHAIAQNNPNVKDWRVRATVNGTSFAIEDWQPIYLKGFEPGENWVQLELIDEAGNNIENAFNNTVRVFTYDPRQNDTLAKLVTEQVTLAEAQSLVKPDDVTSEIIAGDSVELEPQNDVEPEIIADNLVDSVAEPEIVTQIAPTDNEPSVSSASPAEDNRIAAAQAALETNLIEPELKDKEPKVIEPSSDIKNTTPDSVVVDDSVRSESEPETTETTVIISEADSNREQPIKTIVIPQPESVEVSEGEVAIIVPQTELKPKADSSLWWKKILINLRQKIEALAKKLPNEV
jgi:hypothetical protein